MMPTFLPMSLPAGEAGAAGGEVSPAVLDGGEGGMEGGDGDDGGGGE